MRGFSLVEMLVVVALLAIMGVLAVAALGPLNARYRVTQGTELTQQELYQARTWARDTSRCHRIEVFDLSLDAGVGAGTPGDALIVERRANADCEDPPGSSDYELVEVVRMPQPNVRVQAPAGQPEVLWRPNGRLFDGGTGDLFVGEMVGGVFKARSQIQLRPQGALCVTDPTAPGACP